MPDLNATYERAQPPDVLVAGASARAAAQSAVRASLRPCAVDIFCDEDLLACCPAERCLDYPEGLARIAADMPQSPWLYTGAIENHPDLIDRISGRRPLWGNSAAVVARVRDPMQITGALHSAGLAAPRCTRSSSALPADGSWLRKPLQSAGGTRISPWLGKTTKQSDRGNWYFQERVEGIPIGVIYVAADRRATLLGVTRQLIGVEWVRARGFQYAGSIGPVCLSDRLSDELERIGFVLSNEFHLRGLFGVDAIISRGRIWPVEVNPRYTASVEVLERALRIHALQWHADACQTGTLPGPIKPYADECAGKVVLYARRSLTVHCGFPAFVATQNSASDWPTVADIPSVGSSIACGKPVVTLMAAAATATEVEARLRELVVLANRHMDGNQ